MSRLKIRADARGIASALSAVGVDLTKLPAGEDGWHSRESIRAAARSGWIRVRPAPEPAAGPWGDRDPVQWALDTGRITTRSAAQWRASYAADPAGVGRTLAGLYPVLAPAGARGGPAPAPVSYGRPGYEVNPLYNALAAPIRASANASGQPAPTLFASGDLPPMTASGLDPAELMRVPAAARHAIAATRDRAEAFQMIESYTDNPDGAAVDFAGHPGNLAYRDRMDRWVADNASDDALYELTYGPEALAEAQRAEAAEHEARRSGLQRQLDELDGL